MTTGNLKRVRIADADFENPDGSELKLDIDYLGEWRRERSMAGPLISLKKGETG